MRNRFEFLELGEDGEMPPRPAPSVEAGEQPLGGRDPIAERGPDGEPLAQVRVEDTRGYHRFLQQEQEAVAGDALRDRLRATPRALRAVEVFGERGGAAGQFNYPAGLAVDGGGVLFIADSYNHRVQRVTPDGGVSPLGGRGGGRGQFLSPQGVATDAANAFYVVEQGNHRVQKYAEDGSLQLVFGRLGTREGDFRGPTGIAVGPVSGCIYVADAGNGRVQKFDPAGHFLAAFASAHAGASFSPQAVSVDRDENLYVADPFDGRVWRFDGLGRASGPMTAQFHQPRALACGADGLVYVADAGPDAPTGFDADAHGRVQALHGAQGRVLATVEKVGRRLGGLARPGGLAVVPPSEVGRRGDLYVADTRHHRILRFLWE